VYSKNRIYILKDQAMGDVQERIAAARKEAEQLKEKNKSN